MKIADIHAHIFPEKLAEKASHSIGSFYGVSIGREADMPRLCAEDKLAGITRCAVSNSATNASQVQNANTFLAEAVRGHDGYVAFGTIYPGMDGFETLEEIRKESSLPILMFTSKNDSVSKVRGLRAGADDYLTKPFDMDELIARIVSLIRRYTRFNSQDGAIQQLEFDGLQIDLENRSITTGNGTFELPPKEFDLLLYCAKNQGKILTKQQIYEKVWGEEYFYDDSNIMAIISRLRKKLEVNPSSPKYIQTIKGIGYRFNKEV